MAVRLPAIIPGDDYPITLTFRVNGAPVDQVGNSVQIMVKLSPDDADAQAKVNRTVNASAPDAAMGIIRVPLTAAETKSLAGNDAAWVQARRTASGQKRSPLLVQVKVLNAVIEDA